MKSILVICPSNDGKRYWKLQKKKLKIQVIVWDNLQDVMQNLQTISPKTIIIDDYFADPEQTSGNWMNYVVFNIKKINYQANIYCLSPRFNENKVEEQGIKLTNISNEFLSSLQLAS